MSQILTLFFVKSISPKTKCVYVTLRNFRNIHKFLIFPSSRDQVPHSQLPSTCKKKLSLTEFPLQFRDNFITWKLKSLISAHSEAREFFRQDTLKYYTYFKVYIPKTKCVYVTLRNFRNIMHKFLIFPSSRDQVPYSQLLSNCKKISQTNRISSKIQGPFRRLKTKKPYVRSLTSPR